MEFQDEIADEVTTDVCKIEVDDWVVLIYKKEIFIRTVEMIRDKKYVVCMDSCEVNLFKDAGDKNWVCCKIDIITLGRLIAPKV